ncbi:MAG: hypothetical protein AAF739_16955 [Pseudomonadota bacterium]
MSAYLEISVSGKPVLRGQAFWWEKLRAMGAGSTFTAAGLDALGNDPHSANVRDFVRRLVAAGIASLDHEEPNPRGGSPTKVYRLQRTPRRLPPLTRSGKPGLQQLGQQNMWNQLRLGKPTTARELADFSSTDEVRVSLGSAKAYLGHLNGAGYLLITRASKGSRPASYKLKPGKNTGPNAPLILTGKVVFDPNTDEVPSKLEAEVSA